MAELAKLVISAVLGSSFTLIATLAIGRLKLKADSADCCIDHLDSCVLKAETSIRKIAGGAPDDSLVDQFEEERAKLWRDVSRRFAKSAAMPNLNAAIVNLDAALQAADPTSRTGLGKDGAKGAIVALREQQKACRRAILVAARETFAYRYLGRHSTD